MSIIQQRCECGRRFYSPGHDRCARCRGDVFDFGTITETRPDGTTIRLTAADQQRIKEEQGRAAWAALHAYPIDHADDWDGESARVWFCDTWSKMIPRYCSCAEKWSTILAEHPPWFGSAKCFWQWTVRVHNVVNERLGKPVFMPPEPFSKS